MNYYLIMPEDNLGLHGEEMVDYIVIARSPKDALRKAWEKDKPDLDVDMTFNDYMEEVIAVKIPKKNILK